MDDRIVEFVRGLRAAGAAVSTAEEIDAFEAVRLLGVDRREIFKSVLRVTLIKNKGDFPVFEELFPIYFSHHDLALQDALEDLSAADQSRLQQVLASFDERLNRLLSWLLTGEGPSAEELEALLAQSGLDWATSRGSSIWVTRRMLQQLGFGQLEEKLAQLAQELRDLGMSGDLIQRLLGIAEANREILMDHVASRVRLEISRRQAERPRDIQGPDLMQKSFQALSAQEMALLREEVQRIVNQLKTRAALRRKQAIRGRFDARATIRRSQRYGGVPLELLHKKKKLKPDIVLIFDVSRSMQTVIEFLLHFVLAMQDQVSRLRSFAFYDNLGEVTAIVKQADRREMTGVFSQIQRGIPGYLWRTNLGYSLHTFFDRHLAAVNSRSTVIIIGDGRNNYEDPRLDLVRELQRRAKKLVWFTPENQQLWGSGDSDMNHYADACDEVYLVRNLGQLASAIDHIFLE